MRTTARLFVFLVAAILCLVSNQPVLFVVGAALCGMFALTELAAERWQHAAIVKVSCFALLLMPAFMKPEIGFSPVFYALASVASLLAAWALAQYPSKLLARVFQWVYVAFALAVALGLALHIGEPDPMGQLLPNTSANGIPSYMLVLQVGVSMSFFARYGRLPMLSPWITGWIAFMGEGRGSLVVAGLLICATLAFNLLRRKSRLDTHLFRVLLALLLVSLAFLVGPMAYDWIVLHTKLSAGLIDTHRVDILIAYWSKLDAVSFFIGTDFSGTVIDELYNGNPHVAFLRTHSFFGLPLTLMALCSPLVVVWAPIPWRQKWVYSSFCGLLVIRSMTEPILFPTLLDLIYFTVLFLPFRRDTISSRGAWKNRVRRPPKILRPQSPSEWITSHPNTLR